MRFDWTDLRIFLHVCDAGSMTGAAARCHLTLAAVSARIRSLEESSGVLLLQRQARGVQPTAAGEVLAGHARLVFDQVQRLERDLLHAPDRAAPPLVLLVNSSALARPLVLAVAEAQSAEAARPLLVRESPSEATVQALRCGAADVGIVSDAVDTRGLQAMELGPDPLVLVVPRTDALAARTSVTLREVLGQPWVGGGEQTALSAHLQMRALALGARIEPRITYPTLEGALHLVRAGLGITVLPRAVVQGHAAAGDCACIPLDEPWARRRLLVCWMEGAADARTRLAEAVARHWPGPER